MTSINQEVPEAASNPLQGNTKLTKILTAYFGAVHIDILSLLVIYSLLVFDWQTRHISSVLFVFLWIIFLVINAFLAPALGILFIPAMLTAFRKKVAITIFRKFRTIQYLILLFLCVNFVLPIVLNAIALTINAPWMCTFSTIDALGGKDTSGMVESCRFTLAVQNQDYSLCSFFGFDTGGTDYACGLEVVRASGSNEMCNTVFGHRSQSYSLQRCMDEF